jgi:hypothetical protein
MVLAKRQSPINLYLWAPSNGYNSRYSFLTLGRKDLSCYWTTSAFPTSTCVLELCRSNRREVLTTSSLTDRQRDIFEETLHRLSKYIPKPEDNYSLYTTCGTFSEVCADWRCLLWHCLCSLPKSWQMMTGCVLNSKQLIWYQKIRILVHISAGVWQMRKIAEFDKLLQWKRSGYYGAT